MYLIVDEAISLIDAGVKTEEAWETLKTQLSDLGFQTSDIDQIFLTHHHPDHIGLVEKFPQATLLAHPNVDVWLRQDKQFLTNFRSEEHTSELQSRGHLVCRLLLE